MQYRQYLSSFKNIFKSGELDKNAVTEEYSATASDGKNYKTNFYSLEAIIAVGYRVNSSRGSQFRIWATEKLKNYILKGFAIDTDRFKYGTRFDTRYFEVLQDKGKVSREVAKALAEKEFDVYRIKQDKEYISDFDSIVKKLKKPGTKES